MPASHGFCGGCEGWYMWGWKVLSEAWISPQWVRILEGRWQLTSHLHTFAVLPQTLGPTPIEEGRKSCH